jgi:hypothetical protein
LWSQWLAFPSSKMRCVYSFICCKHYNCYHILVWSICCTVLFQHDSFVNMKNCFCACSQLWIMHLAVFLILDWVNWQLLQTDLLTVEKIRCLILTLITIYQHLLYWKLQIKQWFKGLFVFKIRTIHTPALMCKFMSATQQTPLGEWSLPSHEKSWVIDRKMIFFEIKGFSLDFKEATSR